MKDPFDMTDEELEAAVHEIRSGGGGAEVFDESNKEDQSTQEDITLDSFEADDDTTVGLDDSTEPSADDSLPNNEKSTAGGVGAASQSPVSVRTPKVRTFRAGGQDFHINEAEAWEQFPKVFDQAMKYSKEIQQLKPWRQSISALEEARLNHKDVSLAIDVLKGNKHAINEVLRRNSIDPMDIAIDEEADKPYQIPSYGKSEAELRLSSVVDSIKHDPEYVTTHKILSSEWDDASWNRVVEDPDTIRKLHEEVSSGRYQVIQPIAAKLKLYDNGRQSDLDYYIQALRQEMYQHRAQSLATQNYNDLARVRQQDQQRQTAMKDAGKRRAAAPTAKTSRGNKVVDYLNASEDEFEEWLEKTLS